MSSPSLLRRLDYLPRWAAVALGLAVGVVAGGALVAELPWPAALVGFVLLLAGASWLAWRGEPVEESAKTPPSRKRNLIRVNLLRSLGLGQVWVERLAIAFHEEDGHKSPEDRLTLSPALEGWGNLAEALKATYRKLAEDTIKTLIMAGFQVRPAAAPRMLQLMPTEVEHLSILDHDRFVKERESRGWTYGPYKNADRKIYPFLAPWAHLHYDTQESVRATTRRLPAILKKAGLEIYRRAHSAPIDPSRRRNKNTRSRLYRAGILPPDA